MIKPTEKSKLTLWISKDSIHFGKKWSRQHNQSLSELFDRFLQRLRDSDDSPQNTSPLTQSIRGVLKGENQDFKQQYLDHLIEKHLSDD